MEKIIDLLCQHFDGIGNILTQKEFEQMLTKGMKNK